MLYKDKYYGLTHLFFWTSKNFIYNLWEKYLCKKGIHLLDEVWSDSGHFLVCDACNLMVNIESIDDEYVKKSKGDFNDFF